MVSKFCYVICHSENKTFSSVGIKHKYIGISAFQLKRLGNLQIWEDIM